MAECAESFSTAPRRGGPNNPGRRVCSGYGVNYRHGFIHSMDNVVSDYKGMPVENDMPVEITQNEESGEEEPGTPERKRNPGI